MKTFGLQVAVILLLVSLKVRAEFAYDMLHVHNEFRSKHGTPDLKINAEGCIDCTKYAQLLARKNKLEPTEKNDIFGENLCIALKDPLDCANSWYDEHFAYNYERPGYSPTTRHFTQLIWRHSKFLSVGKAQGQRGKHFVVARYMPPGNIDGEYEENVPRKNIAGRLFYSSIPYFLVTLCVLPFINPKVISQI